MAYDNTIPVDSLPIPDIPDAIRTKGEDVIELLRAETAITPSAGKTPKADANAKIAADWLPIDVAFGIAGLDANAQVPTAQMQDDLQAFLGSGINHNSIWRGAQITPDTAFWAAIADGSFKDIYIGDYFTTAITISGTSHNCNFVVVDIDPFYASITNKAMVNTHHLGVVITGELPDHRMHSSATTSGGYVGSEMHTWLTGDVLTGLTANTTIGSHLLGHSLYLTNSIGASLNNKSGSANGASNGNVWVDDCKISLMTEIQAYGAPIGSSSLCDTGEGRQQLSAFKLKNISSVLSNTYFWLRDIANSTNYCFCDATGTATSDIATKNAAAPRPLILLKG